MALVTRVFTRVIYQAHMEVQMRMASTEPTVMNTVQPTAARKPYWSMAAV